MHLYRLRYSGELKTAEDLRALFPGHALPARLSAAALEELGADPVLNGPTPACGPGEELLPDGVVQDAAGNWLTSFKVVKKG